MIEPSDSSLSLPLILKATSGTGRLLLTNEVVKAALPDAGDS